MSKHITQTLASLERALAYEFTILPVRTKDAPIFMAVAWPTAAGLTGLKPRLPAGRGMTAAQARLAAGAEAVELRASLAQNHHASLTGLRHTDAHRTVPAVDLLTGDTVAVPGQAVFLDFAATCGETRYDDADSTGCATSTDLQSAIEAALRECLERDALALWWHGRLPGRALPVEGIDTLHPRLGWWLSARPRRTVLLDITTDTRLPVVVAASADRDGRNIALGSAAHPDRTHAALAAVTEMIQTETAMAEAHAAGDDEVAEWIAQGSTGTMVQFTPQGVAAPQGPMMDLNAVLTRLDRLGHRALAVDLSLPDDPLTTARVMVPGLCAMGRRIDQPRFARLAPGRTAVLPEPY